MKLCFVVQRFGAEIQAGAEMHCRWLATRLAARHEVEVVTTCAKDYREWRNHYPAGSENDGGLRVTRYPVERSRDTRRFALYSDIVFRDHHTPQEERLWVEENGPFAPALVGSLAGRTDVDLFVFYSYRYYTTCIGLPTVAERAVLVPTAEDDAALTLPIFHHVLRAARGLVYLTPEEQQLVEQASDNADRPSVVVGCGVDVPGDWRNLDARERFDLPARYALYVGRVDWAKGVDKLADYWQRLGAEWPECPPLVLAGQPLIELPEGPRLRALGAVSEAEKFALLDACGLLVLPSALESLSIAVLESWRMGRPVLVNAECRVLEGQCRRSDGGLYYRGYAEFAPAARLLLEDDELARILGEQGRQYAAREYDWSVVAARTERLLEQVLMVEAS